MRRNLLTLDDLTKEEILGILELAKRLKRNPIKNYFRDTEFCLLFEKPSLRTRISFEIGIKQLGGTSVFLDKSTGLLSRKESWEDTVKVLERYNDAIIARVYSHETLKKIVRATEKPVINALSDLAHPCQILSDLFTINEYFKYFDGVKLAFVGDGNNVCNSLLLGCSKVGIDISVACPKGFEPNDRIVELAKNYSKITKSKIEILENPKLAVKDANIVYNDTFVSMGDEKEAAKKLNVFLPKYQVNEQLMNHSQDQSIYMHCLPAHRGQEVTGSVIDGTHSIVFDQAENRLHVQKALLLKIMR